MAGVDIVRLNGTPYSWTSCLFKVDNRPFKGIVEVNYEQARDVSIVYAALKSGRPLGMTSGKYSVKAFSVKFLKSSSDVFTDQLTAKGRGSYGDPYFGFIAQVSEPVSGSRPLTTAAPWTRVIGKKDSYAEGIDALVDEFTFASLWLTENGKRLWSAVRSLDE
jgi:hypothetical protein